MVAYILAGILGVLFLGEKIRSRKQYLLFETILKKLTDGEPLDGNGLKEGSTAVLLERAKQLENKRGTGRERDGEKSRVGHVTSVEDTACEYSIISGNFKAGRNRGTTTETFLGEA